MANARPAGERRNPWVFNLRHSGEGRVRVQGRTFEVSARELNAAEIERWWPSTLEAWPAFGWHYANTGERTMFVLEPADTPEGRTPE